MDLDLKNLPDDASQPKDTVISLIDEIEVKYEEEVCEKLDYIPARLRVERHIRYKCVCKGCEGVENEGPSVKIAPRPRCN